MRLLIDGYNLMFSAGFADPKLPDKLRLKNARRRLLDYAAERVRGRAELRFVFDAEDATSDARTETKVHGFEVSFSYRRTADDQLEDEIRAEHDPKGLTVVSDDVRVRLAAGRRGCEVWSNGDLLDWLNDPGPPPSKEPEPEEPPKPERVSREEVAYWLREFGAK